MKSSTFTFTELSALCLELRLFLHAGADGSSAFSLLAEDCDDPELKNEYSHIASRIDEGLSLSAAMEESARFPKEMWSFLRIGESCGRSEEALSSLEKYYQQRHQWDRQLRSALLYPSVLLMVMLLVILLLLTEVLPIFKMFIFLLDPK